MVVQGFDFVGFRAREHPGRAIEWRRLAGLEPFDQRPFPRVLRHPFRDGYGGRREQHAAAVAGGVAGRLLVGEDGLERVVAADGHVAGGEVRSSGQRDERGDSDRPAASRGVDDREEAEGEQGEVEPEQERE